MGINPTQSNFKSFTFDGTNSRTYGVYITGEGVFNAPERNVEMLDIAGRNGAFVLDKGNFNNIEVTYPASIATDNATDFAQAVSDLRNFLCSKVGYVRLEDDYNPNEYRMAIYKSGLEVSHDMLIAGEFDLVFECKPQRYLTSGETATAVASGNSITNPTLFDAKPQLQVYGYGDINIGDSTITVSDGEFLGYVQLMRDVSPYYNIPESFEIPQTTLSSLNPTDSIIISSTLNTYSTFFIIQYKADEGYYSDTIATAISNCNIQNQGIVWLAIDEHSFSKGTSETFNFSATLDVSIRNKQTNVTTTTTVTATGAVVYDGDDTLTFSLSLSPSTVANATLKASLNLYEVYGYSTKTALGNPLYIDLDIGEAWNEDTGVVISVNDAVSMPAELPVLPSGATTFTYDNTITQLKVVPRWWKV